MSRSEFSFARPPHLRMFAPVDRSHENQRATFTRAAKELLVPRQKVWLGMGRSPDVAGMARVCRLPGRRHRRGGGFGRRSKPNPSPRCGQRCHRRVRSDLLVERRTAALALGWQVTMAQVRILKTWHPGAARRTLCAALLAFAALFSASCTSMSQEQIIANDHSHRSNHSNVSSCIGGRNTWGTSKNVPRKRPAIPAFV